MAGYSDEPDGFPTYPLDWKVRSDPIYQLALARLPPSRNFNQRAAEDFRHWMACAFPEMRILLLDVCGDVIGWGDITVLGFTAPVAHEGKLFMKIEVDSRLHPFVFMNTLLHELAHAWVLWYHPSVNDHHGPIWRMMLNDVSYKAIHPATGFRSLLEFAHLLDVSPRSLIRIFPTNTL